MAFLAPLRRVLAMFHYWKEIEELYNEIMYVPRPLPFEQFGVDDYVKKVTGDYHVSGYIVSVFRTKETNKLRYVVEITAEGGGTFCHIFAQSNLELIRLAPPNIARIRKARLLRLIHFNPIIS